MQIKAKWHKRLSQVKSSQIFLLQQNKYHTYNNIRDWNPFGFICLLKYIHYSYRAWPHFGDNKVSTGASTEAKRSPKGTGRPPQAALVFMLKTSSTVYDSKVDPTMTTTFQCMTMMPNILVWKYHRVYIAQENMPYVYQCSLCAYSSVYVIPTNYRLDKMADMLQMTFSLTKVFLFCFKVQWMLFTMVQIDTKPVFASAMSWHYIGNKPLPELMLTSFTDAYMSRRGTKS